MGQPFLGYWEGCQITKDIQELYPVRGCRSSSQSSLYCSIVIGIVSN